MSVGCGEMSERHVLSLTGTILHSRMLPVPEIQLGLLNALEDAVIHAVSGSPLIFVLAAVPQHLLHDGASFLCENLPRSHKLTATCIDSSNRKTASTAREKNNFTLSVFAAVAARKWGRHPTRSPCYPRHDARPKPGTQRRRTGEAAAELDHRNSPPPGSPFSCHSLLVDPAQS
jgi:hypothetical protein